MNLAFEFYIEHVLNTLFFLLTPSATLGCIFIMFYSSLICDINIYINVYMYAVFA